MNLSVTLLLALGLNNHPVHVSMTSIDIDTGTRVVRVAHKFFTDDFSLLFYHLYEKNVQPQEGKDFTNAELDLINKYISGVFVLDWKKTTPPLRYVRKDQDELSTWLYFEGELPSGDSRELMLTNMLMLDLYEDQTNLVIISDGKSEKGYTFNFRDRQLKIDLASEAASGSASGSASASKLESESESEFLNPLGKELLTLRR